MDNAWLTVNLISLRMQRSLISIAETDRIMETARRLGRTTISLQVQRLEEFTGKQLFADDSIQVELRCVLSALLVGLVKRGEVDSPAAC